MTFLDAFLDLVRQQLATARSDSAKLAALVRALRDADDAIHDEHIAYAARAVMDPAEDPRVVAYHDMRECLACAHLSSRAPMWLARWNAGATGDAYTTELRRLADGVRERLRWALWGRRRPVVRPVTAPPTAPPEAWLALARVAHNVPNEEDDRSRHPGSAPTIPVVPETAMRHPSHPEAPPAVPSALGPRKASLKDFSFEELRQELIARWQSEIGKRQNDLEALRSLLRVAPHGESSPSHRGAVGPAAAAGTTTPRRGARKPREVCKRSRSSGPANRHAPVAQTAAGPPSVERAHADA